MLANTAQFQPITLAQLNSLGYKLDLSDLKESDDLENLIGFDDLWYDDYADNLGIWTAEQQAAIDAQNAAAEAVLAGQESLGKSENERLATLKKRINKLVKISNDIEDPDYDTLTDDAFNGRTYWNTLGYTFDDDQSSTQLETLGFTDFLKKAAGVAKKALPVAAAAAAVAAPIAGAAGGDKAGNIAEAVAEGLGSLSKLQLEALSQLTDQELQQLGFGSFFKKAVKSVGKVAKKAVSVGKKALPVAAAAAAVAVPIAQAAGGDKAGAIAGAVSEGLDAGAAAAGLMSLSEPELSTLLEALSEEDLQALMQYSI